MNVRIATPAGYDCDATILRKTEDLAKENGTEAVFTTNVAAEAVEGSDVIATDTCTFSCCTMVVVVCCCCCCCSTGYFRSLGADPFGTIFFSFSLSHSLTLIHSSLTTTLSYLLLLLLILLLLTTTSPITRGVHGTRRRNGKTNGRF